METLFLAVISAVLCEVRIFLEENDHAADSLRATVFLFLVIYFLWVIACLLLSNWDCLAAACDPCLGMVVSYSSAEVIVCDRSRFGTGIEDGLVDF